LDRWPQLSAPAFGSSFSEAGGAILTPDFPARLGTLTPKLDPSPSITATSYLSNFPDSHTVTRDRYRLANSPTPDLARIIAGLSLQSSKI